MPNIFFGRTKGGVMEFDEHESEHLKVVRAEEGQKIEVTDGNGIIYKVILRSIGKKKSYGDIIEAHRAEVPPKNLLKVYIGSSSWERLKLAVEKAVELGADEIIVYKGEKSKRDYTKKRKKLEIVIRDSSKQCRRILFPRLRISSSVRNAVDYESAELLTLDQDGIRIEELKISADKSYAIVVGPESGFSDTEREFLKGKSSFVSLGKRILRFETAAIAMISILAFTMKKL